MENQDYINLLEEAFLYGAINNFLFHIKNPLFKKLNVEIIIDNFNLKKGILKASYIKNNEKINVFTILNSNVEWSLLLINQ